MSESVDNESFSCFFNPGNYFKSAMNPYLLLNIVVINTILP